MFRFRFGVIRYMEVTSKCPFKFVFTSKWAYETTKIIPYKKRDFNTFKPFLSKKQEMSSVMALTPYQKALQIRFLPNYTVFLAFCIYVTVLDVFQAKTNPGLFLFSATNLKIWYVHLPDITCLLDVTFSCNQAKTAQTL